MIRVAYCCSGQVEAEFAISLEASRSYDRGLPEPVLSPDAIQILGGPRLNVLRDAMVRRFLDTDDEWLLSVDADHRWDPDAPHRLLASADPVTRPIVGALCFGSGRSGGGLFPTIYTWNGYGYENVLNHSDDYPRNKLVECDGTGWAWLLIHRSVLERMAEVHDEPAPWFVEGTVEGSLIEPDLAWCLRARNLGYPIYVNTSVEAPHKKPIFLDQAFFDLVRKETQ